MQSDNPGYDAPESAVRVFVMQTWPPGTKIKKERHVGMRKSMPGRHPTGILATFYDGPEMDSPDALIEYLAKNFGTDCHYKVSLQKKLGGRWMFIASHVIFVCTRSEKLI